MASDPRPSFATPSHRATPAPPDRERLQRLMAGELARFTAEHPGSRALHQRAMNSLVSGVPMPWMARWPGGYPIYVQEARGARITDVDGRNYVDLCLGDTGAMTGHSPAAVVWAVQSQIERGVTTMLPSVDSIVVAEELTRRFGVSRWQFTLSATDANRAALRIARQITGRHKILVFSYSYHGTVDETFAVRAEDGSTRSRAGNVGPAVNPAVTTCAIEFNNLAQLEQALADHELACVLAEPAMTNMGIVLPDAGYHAALRTLTRRHGTLLIIDETHTFSAGPGGCTQAWGLAPDLLTIGKALGGGIPCGALGMSPQVVERLSEQHDADYEDTGGVGGTLAGNALAAAAMRATLEQVLTPQAFERMSALASRLREGIERLIRTEQLPWNVTQLGCRVEYSFLPVAARDGTSAHAAADRELESYLHLYLLNRGVLITPFHNMVLISPATTAADIEQHEQYFAAAVAELFAR
ncbi:MAG: transaminase [Steroidobacteraceae bacterium]